MEFESQNQCEYRRKRHIEDEYEDFAIRIKGANVITSKNLLCNEINRKSSCDSSESVRFDWPQQAGP